MTTIRKDNPTRQDYQEILRVMLPDAQPEIDYSILYSVEPVAIDFDNLPETPEPGTPFVEITWLNPDLYIPLDDIEAFGDSQAYGDDSLAMSKQEAISIVDTQAEQARQQFVSPGDLMSAVYRQKQLEAEGFNRVVADGGTPVPGDYPLMASRAERLGVDLADVAAEWTTKAAAWVQVAAAIEVVREQAKDDIRVVTDKAAIKVILEGLVWPMPADDSGDV